MSTRAPIVLVFGVLVAACGGGSEQSGTPADAAAKCPSGCPSGQTCTAAGVCEVAPTDGTTCTPTTLAWLKEGNIWKVAWSEIAYDVGLFNTTGNYDLGTYTMRLGKAVTQSGLTMHPIALDGDTRKYKPLWTSIGTDGCGNVFGANGGTAVRIYATAGTSFSGTGFWTSFTGVTDVAVNRSATVIPSQYTKQVSAVFAPPLTSVGHSDASTGPAGSGCEYFAGYGTICGNDGPGISTSKFIYEYWSSTAGPVAMAYAYDYNSGGSLATESHKEQRVEVWFFGDASNSHQAFENFSSSYVAPTPLSIPSGDNHLFVMYGEINTFEKPAGAIAGVSAVISDATYAQIKSWYPFGQQTGQTVAEQLQDWFSFELTDVTTRTEFYLVWNDDSQLELHWYAAPGNATYGFLYFGQDYLDTAGTLTEFKHVKGIPNPTQPGKYLLGIRRTAPQQAATQYGIMVMH